MGAALQTLGLAEVASEIACCAGSAACGLLCKKKQSSRGIRSRLFYILFLCIGNLLSFLALVPDMRLYLDKVPYFCGTVTSPQLCDSLVGYAAAYRIYFAMTVFYFLLCILTYNVSSTKQFRARLHNGFWYIKLSFLSLVLIAAFYIPFIKLFGMVWMYVGLTGGFMFILLQIVLIIDFGHSWSASWAEKMDVLNTKCWFFGLAFATALMYCISLASAAFLYRYFTNPTDMSQCKANTFYISFNVAHCGLATVISILPQIQREVEGSGLLQSSVVTIYTMYLTWNTLSTQPDSTCNPLGNVILEYDKASGVNGQSVFGSVLTFALLTFACTVRASTSQLGKLGLSLSDSPEYLRQSIHKNRKRRKKKKITKDEEEKEDIEDEDISYSYSVFHFMMFLASLHLMMVLTNWHSPDETADFKKLIKNWSAVWVQMASSFICCLVFIWTLVAPLIRKSWGDFFGLLPEPPRKPTARRRSVAQLKKDFENVREKGKESSVEVKHSKSPVKLSESYELKRRTSVVKETMKSDAPDKSISPRRVLGSSDVTVHKPSEGRTHNKSISPRRTVGPPEVTPRKFEASRTFIDRSTKDIDDFSIDPETTRADDTTRAVIDIPMGRSSPIMEEPRAASRTSVSSGRRLDPLRSVAIQIEHPFAKSAETADFEKAKDPEVVRQVLRLQERILRFQAKIVKVQHKMLHLQQTGEVLLSPSRNDVTKQG